MALSLPTDLTASEKRLLKAAVNESGNGEALGSAEEVAMPTTKKPAAKRCLFRELMAGVDAMREHRESRLKLRTHRVEPIALPELEPRVVRETRASRHSPARCSPSRSA